MAKGTCAEDGCNKPTRTRGWCVDHYHYWLRRGLPLLPKRTALDRFMAMVSVSDSGCWLWTGSRNKYGYALFTPKRTTSLGGRWIYTQLVGPIPAGLQLDHFVCEVRHCVNPTHVRPVTPQENVLRGASLQAENKAKQFCVNGHPLYGPDSDVKLTTRGQRRCRICERERQRRYRSERKGRQ